MNGTTVFFDFETGGTDRKHPNIQLAAVAVRGWNEVAHFERKIRFDPNTCDPEALRINGYTPEAWAGAVHEGDAAFEFKDFLERHADMTLTSKRGKPYTTARLAGHNVHAFDCPRLKEMMDRHLMGAFWPGCWWYPLDTYPVSIWYCTTRGIAVPDYQLQTLARAFGIESQGEAHEALADVRTCVRIAEVMAR